MDKMLVVVFDNEQQAYAGTNALRELHQEGNLVVYAAAVIGKDSAGKVEVKQAADEGPIGTAVGMFTGSLIGLIGGPAGVAVGAATGALVGSIADLNNAGVDLQFVEEVGQQMLPGKAAVVAEIAEGWGTPLDTRMSAIGGIVLRRNRADVVAEQMDREIAAEEAELARLRDELQKASADAKAHIRTKIDAVSEKLESLAEKAAAKAEALKDEADAKVKSLQEQATKAAADLKSQYEKRAAEVKKDCDQRVAKLNQACKLTKQALVG